MGLDGGDLANSAAPIEAELGDMAKTYSELMDSHRANRREALLRTAAEVICERGIHLVTMEQIAERVGLSKIVLYRYFGARDKLVHAVLERIVTLVLEADAAPADWWTERVGRSLKVAEANAASFKLLIRHAAHDPEFGHHFERLNEAIVQRVRERSDAILGDQGRNNRPASDRLYAESVSAFLFDAFARWIEEGRPEKEAAYLSWVTKSIRGMGYYWRGLWPPDSEPAAPDI